MLENGNTQLTAGEVMASVEKAPVKKEEHERSENVVIIPTYNEASNLKLLIPRILQQGPFDVLIVDDNSPDGSGEVAEQFAAQFPERVTVLHRAGKLGLGISRQACRSPPKFKARVGSCRTIAGPGTAFSEAFFERVA